MGGIRTSCWCWLDGIFDEPTPKRRAQWDRERRREEIAIGFGCLTALIVVVGGLIGFGVFIGRFFHP